jgi:hypothetical protein
LERRRFVRIRKQRSEIPGGRYEYEKKAVSR